MLVLAVIGVASGGYSWTHHLLGLVPVAVVCGSPVYLRLGVDRTIAPVPTGCG